MKRSLSWFAFAGICVCFIGMKHLAERELASLDERAPSLYEQAARFHADSLRRYSLGFDFVMADLLWLRLLDKARTKEVEPGKVSWEFAQLDAITSLDRNFARAYPFGGAFLSVFLRDNVGAKLILEKWVRNFPSNWRAHYTLGYHLYFEMGQFKPASGHILTAAEMTGAPPWLPSLGIRLLSETGSLAQALRMAIGLVPALKDEEGKLRLMVRIRSLVYSLQKASWEAALDGFRKEHKSEPSNMGDIQPHFVSQTREIASVLGDTDMPDEVRPLFAEVHSFRYDSAEKKIVPVKLDPTLERSGIYRPKS